MGLAFAILALPVTGSRAVVAVFSVVAVAMFFGGIVARIVSSLSLLRALLMLGVVVAISLSAQDAAWDAFQQRVSENREEGAPRVITAFTNAFDYFDAAGAFGFGAGSSNLGAVALAPDEIPFSWLPVRTAFEEESGRLVLELGIVGWSISLLLRIAILAWAIRLVFQGATPLCRAAAVLALPFTAIAVHQGNGVFAPSFMAVAYWFCVALLAIAQYECRKAPALPPTTRHRSRATHHLGSAL
jgi:hypothetical protein